MSEHTRSTSGRHPGVGTGGRQIGAGGLLLALIAGALCCPPGSTAQEPEFDLLVRGGTVVDGTGAPAFRADVAVRGDRIVRVAREGVDPHRAREVVDAGGLVVAPGFIDNHAHIATNIHEYPLAENFIRQGITTILASLHSGAQAYPLREYAASLRVAPNVGFFAGHSFAREKVIGRENRAPNAAELDQMRSIVEEAMRDGALGLSTGLVYVPANYASTEEVIELARVAARHGGIYVSHMRDEATGLLESVAELIRISREAGLPAQINHHKAVGGTQWGWTERTLAMIDSARAQGLDIKHDLYPYTASSTSSSVLFPQWALAGGADEFRNRIGDAATRARIEREMREIFEKERAGGELSRVQFRTVPSLPAYNGKTLGDLARDRGLPQTLESGIALAIELQVAGGFSAIYHAMDEQDVIRILQHPQSMIETDGDPVGFGVGFPHPRSYGSFPRVLARYVREQKVISLEEAIRKMSSMPADQIGQADRGRIREGAFADLTIFHPDEIQDLATFEAPHQFSLGVRHVVVNGTLVLRGGALTGATPGRVLRGPARPRARQSPGSMDRLPPRPSRTRPGSR